MPGPAIVIGSSAEQRLPSLVLEHSILKRAAAPPRIIHSWDRTFPAPKRPENRSRTGFSFVRFAIPQMMGYEGVGAYLECDQLVFRDVAQLLALPFRNAKVLRPKNQASVLLLDCGALRWDVAEIVRGLDKGEYSYRNLMERLCVVPEAFIDHTIPGEWNSLEKYEPGKTALLHYTNMAGQPWRRWGHPLGSLWMNELADGVKAGRIPLSAVQEEVARKHVVPQVLSSLRTML
jgi:hypothetical protein